MLDGAARIDDLVAAAHADGQPAVAITDHGVLYGVVDFYKAATKQGIKPIIGIEAYLTPGSRFDRPPRRDDVRYHMNLLAVNETGYSNLMKLASKAYLDGFYYKPRMDDELLAEHAEGIIATSGCLGGPVAQLLGPDANSEEGNSGGERDYDGALAAADAGRPLVDGRSGDDHYLLYTGGTMPESEQDQKAVMAAWGAWYDGMGSAVVDGGSLA